MAFLVLALGAIMAAAGSYLMVYGNGYIAMEQGWSAFISGSVLLTGGLVTVALGLALRALADLRNALMQHGERPTAGDARAAQAHAVDASTAEPVPAAVPFEPSDAFALRPSLDADEPFPAPRGQALLAPVPPTAPEPSAAEPAVREEAPIGLSSAVNERLDRSFADLNREFAELRAGRVGGEPPAPIRAEPIAPIDERHGTQLSEPEAEAPVAARGDPRPEERLAQERIAGERPAEVPPPAEAPVPAASPVIGRYESEGTSYVMYADGSIEAQSEAGVYRFASMAELRSFIEG